jgi:hypothetical protein
MTVARRSVGQVPQLTEWLFAPSGPSMNNQIKLVLSLLLDLMMHYSNRADFCTWSTLTTIAECASRC